MLNKMIIARIENLKKVAPRNLIFQGDAQETMKEYACEVAAAWLNTTVEELRLNPDYKYLEGIDGVIGVENAGVIREMASYIPQGECAVAVIAHAETMTVEMQNRLLKVLEDRAESLAVIFITSYSLLDTIHSRCIQITVSNCSLNDIFQRAECPIPACVYASDGNWETYQRIVADVKFSQQLEGFFESYRTTKTRDGLKYVLRYAHALHEKDPEYFPGIFENWQMEAFLAMLERVSWYILLDACGVKSPGWVQLGKLPELYTKEEADKIYRSAVQGKYQRRKKGKFTKNDFFSILMELIPVE